MAVIASLVWEVSPEQYKAAIEELGLDEDAPDGGIVHVAGYDGDVLRVTDSRRSARARCPARSR